MTENGMRCGTIRLSKSGRGVNFHLNLDKLNDGIKDFYRSPESNEKIVVVCCAVENIEDILNSSKKLTPLIHFPE